MVLEFNKNKIFWPFIILASIFVFFIFTDDALAHYSGQYWNLDSPTASPSIPIDSSDATTSDETINFDWGDGSPTTGINADGFVVVWTQTIDFASGTYSFYATSDDGVRVYIDETLIINSWIDQGSTLHSTTTAVSAGSHIVKVEYYENAGGAVIQFSYQNLAPSTPSSFSAAANSTSSITWSWNDNSSNETGFKIYNSLGSLIATTSANATSYQESLLSENTQYSRYVAAYNSYGENNSSQFSRYTLVSNPTNFIFTQGDFSVTLSVSQFANDTTGSSGYYFYRSEKNSGWIQNNTWTDSSLFCSADYSVKYRNGDSVETSVASISASTRYCVPQDIPMAFFLAETNTADGTTTQTTTEDFIIATTSIEIGKNLPAENHPIIFYQTTTIEIGGESLATTTHEKYLFLQDLKYGDVSEDVRQLQIFLNNHGYIISSEGIGSPGNETEFFGKLTKKALIKFQEDNFESILAPLNLNKGTGWFYFYTRELVNSF